MVAHALRGCGLRPGYLIGGELRTTGRNAGWGAGEWLVVEADESDRSFLALDAEIAVVTNVELDHHATYASQAELERGVPGVPRAAAAGASCGTRPDARRCAADALATFDVAERSSSSRAGRVSTWRGVTVRAAGAGRAQRAQRGRGARRLPARRRRPARCGAALALRRRRPPLRAARARRGGALVVDDYAHHPTEVEATIDAARRSAPRPLVAVFQPHLYSRTRALHGEFGAALALADVVVVLDVYPARERPRTSRA